MNAILQSGISLKNLTTNRMKANINYYVLRMEILDNLWLSAKSQIKVKRYLQVVGYCLSSEVNEALENKSSDEVFRIILEWIGLKMKNKTANLPLRKHNKGKTAISYIGIRVTNTSVHIDYVHDLPSNLSQHEYLWKPHVTYADRPVDEMNYSAMRAQEANYALPANLHAFPKYDAKLGQEVNQMLDELPNAPTRSTVQTHFA